MTWKSRNIKIKVTWNQDRKLWTAHACEGR